MRITLLVAIGFAAALHGVELANEDKAYGALHGRIAARIQLWPGLAPHETKADPGKYVFDAKRKVWRRTAVSQPEVVILKPEKPTHDTLVVVMPGGGYQSQHLGHVCRESLRTVL